MCVCAEDVIEGLDLAVATMKRKEVALIIIDPEYGFGDAETKTKVAVVPASSTLYYEVEMVGFTKVGSNFNLEDNCYPSSRENDSLSPICVVLSFHTRK